MKRKIFILALAIGLAAGAWTGTARAGQTNDADPEGAFIQSWVSHGAVETGSLPDAAGTATKRMSMASGEDRFPVVDIGGIPYRVGLDTGP